MEQAEAMRRAEEKLERLRQKHRNDYRKHRPARLAYQQQYKAQREGEGEGEGRTQR